MAYCETCQKEYIDTEGIQCPECACETCAKCVEECPQCAVEFCPDCCVEHECDG